jgi:hypothetical protein
MRLIVLHPESQLTFVTLQKKRAVLLTTALSDKSPQTSNEKYTATLIQPINKLLQQ